MKCHLNRRFRLNPSVPSMMASVIMNMHLFNVVTAHTATVALLKTIPTSIDECIPPLSQDLYQITELFLRTV